MQRAYAITRSCLRLFQRPVMSRLDNLRGFDVPRPGDIGDSARDAQDAVAGARCPRIPGSRRPCAITLDSCGRSGHCDRSTLQKRFGSTPGRLSSGRSAVSNRASATIHASWSSSDYEDLLSIPRNRFKIGWYKLGSRLIGEKQFRGIVGHHDLRVEHLRIAVDKLVRRM